jgi:hypothetical protein
MKYILLSLLLLSPLAFADKQRVARTITSKTLNEPCPGKYMEWFAMSDTNEEWGTAQVKVFYLVDKNFLKRAANSGLSGAEWGSMLGQNFRFFCEKSPIVSVRTAVLQTIEYME